MRIDRLIIVALIVVLGLGTLLPRCAQSCPCTTQAPQTSSADPCPHCEPRPTALQEQLCHCQHQTSIAILVPDPGTGLPPAAPTRPVLTACPSWLDMVTGLTTTSRSRDGPAWTLLRHSGMSSPDPGSSVRRSGHLRC